MSSRRLFPAVAAGLFVALAATSAHAQKPYDDPTLERMRKDIFFLASPECEGRGIDTKGIEKAADYIAAAFKEAGLKPAMKDGTYFQPFTVVFSSRLGGLPSLTISGPDGKRELKAGTDFNAMGFSSTSKASGELVFVGYGITAPKLKYDDYDGIDVAGKVVVILRRTPRYSEKPERRFDTTVPTAEESPHAAFATKIENAVAHKAAAVIIVNDMTGASPRDQLFQYGNHAFGTTPANFPVLHMKREVFDAMIAGGPIKSVADIETLIDKDLKPRSFEIKGWKADANVTVDRVEYKCKNIIGVLEGSGPLADETVVIGAHYDHVGYGIWGSLGGAAARGKIHFGADDNGSGSTTVIELARRYGAMKERKGRRLVFMTFSGEERGLLGSIHYCKEPVFPLERTAAMLNLDMVGRVVSASDDWLGIWEPRVDRISVYGAGTGTGFAQLVQDTGKKVPFRMTINPSASLGGAGGSDHQSFDAKRIPTIFMFSGFHAQYHRPTDTPERINVPGMKKVADFTQALADHLTVVPTRPEYQVVRGSTAVAPSGPKGPVLGLVPDYNFEGDVGMRVQQVRSDGPADKGGLKDGDIIIEVAGKPVKNVTGYMAAMSGLKAGTAAEVVVMRKDKKMTIKVTPE